MNKGISKIISDFKSKGISILSVEKALGFSNGMIGKAAKGKYIMSTQKINALLEYYGSHFPSSKDEVVKMLEAPTTQDKMSFEEYRAEIEKLSGFRLWSYDHDAPKFKEGGLYRFENGGFVEQLFENQHSGAPFNITEAMEARIGKNATIPLNKEDEKLRIGTDNICPISKEQCDDETCTPGAECNVSGSSIQKGYVADETKSVVSGVSKKGISEVKIIPPIPVQEKGEDKFDFSARKNDWKRKYGNH